MVNQNSYQRVDEAIERDEIWRAKEILRGAIRSSGYDVELYERYGRLLLDVQEKLEAGKYLFLSRSRRPEYESAIELYLSRVRDDRLYYSFPRSARLREISDYPASIQTDLERARFQVPPKHEYKVESSGIGCWTAIILVAVVAVAVVVLAAVGFWVSVTWLFF